MRATAVLAVVLGATVLAGPSPAAADPSPPPAPAREPAFPDFALFQPADPAQYSAKNWHGDTVGTFRTPDHTFCYFYPDPDRITSFSCTAASIPHFPATVDNQSLPQMEPPGTRINQSVWVRDQDGSYEFALSINTVDESARLLDAGSKIAIGGTGCAVGTGQLLACFDGQHGFMISSAGSWTF